MDRLGPVDWSVIIAYLLAVVGLGVAAGFMRKKGGEGGHYFLAGNTLAWPVIGLAMFAANISTVHLVGFAQSAYLHGLVFGNYEWMAGFTLILLSLFFAPLYLRSRVATLPDFLERRYNRPCRDILTVLSLFSAVVLHMGVALYTAAIVLRGIMGLDEHSTILGISSLKALIIVMGLLTGIYTMLGGLLAVVWTESLQTVLLLLGAVVVTVVGYNKIGGWHELAATLASHPHPLAGTNEVSWGTGGFLHMVRHAGDESKLPWYSVLLGYPVLGIWYWCCDQTIVQRVLAAKDERNARLGPLFCAFLKIFPVLLFVLPGVLCVALVQKGAFGGQAPTSSKETYTFLITHLLPVGLKGLVAAAMLAAAMQTCSAALNSSATLFAYDLWKRWNPASTDSQLVVAGKLTTVIGTILAIVCSPLFGKFEAIFSGINLLISYIAPPITTVFLLGVFWRRASSVGAFVTFIVGICLGAIVFTLGMIPSWSEHLHVTQLLADFMINSFGMFVICMIVMIVVSLATPEPVKPEAEPLIWTSWLEPLRGKAGGRGLGNYRLASAAILIIFVTLYVIFR